MKQYKLTVILLLCILVPFTGEPISASHMENFDKGPYAYLYYSDFSSLDVDGIIEEGEYPDYLELHDIGGNYVNTLYWAHNNTHLSIGMRMIGTGWIGLGLGEVGVSMTGADIIMGYVKGEDVVLEDMSSISQSKPLVDSDSYISENATAGTESNGVTILEFIIPMKSNDTEGKDHNWETNGTYGFFTAFHEKADNLGFRHTGHTESYSVQLLPESILAPSSLIMNLSVVTHEENESISVVIKLTDPENLIDVSNLVIGIYEKSLFGKVLLDIITTEDGGLGQKDIPVEVVENVTIISVLPASSKIKRIEAMDNVNFVNGGEHTDEEYVYGDLRDIFGAHMMRDILLTLFLIVIIALIVSYLGVVLDLFTIYRERTMEEKK